MVDLISLTKTKKGGKVSLVGKIRGNLTAWIDVRKENKLGSQRKNGTAGMEKEESINILLKNHTSRMHNRLRRRLTCWHHDWLSCWLGGRNSGWSTCRLLCRLSRWL